MHPLGCRLSSQLYGALIQDVSPVPLSPNSPVFLPAETQAELKNVMTRHIADRNGEVVAQWLTCPASLAEITNLGMQPVLRLASEVLADERVGGVSHLLIWC